MSKPDLSTAEGVASWVLGLPSVDLTKFRDTETAAYIADAVTMYKQRLENHPATTKRALENERLRVAFDALVAEGEEPQGWARFDGINHERDFEYLRNAMKGGDK